MCDLHVQYLPLTGQLLLTVPDSCQTSDSFQKKKEKTETWISCPCEITSFTNVSN